MAKNLGEKIDIIFLKSLLIEIPTDELPNLLETKEEYTLFLSSLNDTIQEEPEFFLITDEFIKKAENVIEKYRFTYTDEETINLVNEAIVNLNSIRSIDEQTKQINYNLYVADQEVKRHDYIPNSEVLVYMLAHDATLLETMLTGKPAYYQPRYYIGSTNYLINTIPELYEECESIRSQTIINMETIKNTKKGINIFNRAYARKTLKTLKKIKNKEE